MTDTTTPRASLAPTSALTAAPASDMTAAASRYKRPPGLFTQKHLVVIYVLALAGLVIDAALSYSAMSLMFNLPDIITLAVLAGVGVIAAGVSTEAGMLAGRGQPRTAVAVMGFVLLIGLALAGMRLTEGVAGGSAIDPNQFAGAPVATDHNGEWAAVGLMLALFGASATGIFLLSSKIFIAERYDLRREDHARRTWAAQLVGLDAQYTAIHERVAYWKNHSERMEENLDQAHAAADAREEYLKDCARDAIARAVGDPGATPLVRAPHEPATSTPPHDDPSSTGPATDPAKPQPGDADRD